VKTTIEIDSALVEAAEQLARIEGTTLDAVIEDAVRARVECEPANPWLRTVVPRELIYEPASKILDDIAGAVERQRERQADN
jgi:hypothetical protein